MAATRNRPGLTGRPPSRWRVRFAGVGAVLSVALIVALGYRGLRLAGVQFRWEVEEGERLSTRVARRVTTAPSARAESTLPTAEPARGTTTVLEAPFAGDPPPVPAGSGRAARIDFETFGNGGSRCSPCSVSDEWASDGLLVSFRSWTADSTTPFLLDGRDYLPAGSDQHALGPALTGDRGLEVGVIRLDFPGRPRAISFTLYGPDIVPHFAVTAWTGARVLTGGVERAGGRAYDVTGRGLFREERIRVISESGIDRISLDGWGPPGHMLLIDDLVITP